MREIPPTAGLPLAWADFLPGGGPLENALGEFIGILGVQLECSGTAALVVALTTLKRLSLRTDVVIPAYTCPLVAIAIAHCGLRPVLCDLKPAHFDFCPDALERVCGDNTLAVIPTHLGGRVADMVPVLAVARKVGAYVIEDAAQALGARWGQQSAGLAGDIGFFSLAVGKGLSIFEGGVLVARDAAMRRQLRMVSDEIIQSNWAWETRRLLELLGYAALYHPLGLHLAYGNPLRRDIQRGRLIEAVGDDFDFDTPLHRVSRYRKHIGSRALKRLPEFIETLTQQAIQRLRESNLPVMQDAPAGHGTWPYFMILMPSAKARDMALEQLWGAGLGVSRLFIHALPDYGYLRHLFTDDAIPNARDFSARMLTVSNSPWMREEDWNRVRQILQDVG